MGRTYGLKGTMAYKSVKDNKDLMDKKITPD